LHLARHKCERQVIQTEQRNDNCQTDNETFITHNYLEFIIDLKIDYNVEKVKQGDWKVKFVNREIRAR
jgi:hypothetical protein